MTTRVVQSGVQFLTADDANMRVAQSAVQFLVLNFSLASPTQVAQSGVYFLIRPFPVRTYLNWKPACSVQIDPSRQDL